MTASAKALNQQDSNLITYEITLQNLTNGQPFSPPVAVTHSADVRMFNVGGQASDALAAIAQDGDPMPMVELLNDIDSGVTDVVNVGHPLTPSGATATVEGNEVTDSATFTITAAPGDFLSLSTMLICTNDGFVGLDSAALPGVGEEQVFALGGYDAGREENTEVSADLVDPCSALGPVTLTGDPNGNLNDGDIATDPAQPIAAHPGISGGADLSVDAHGWVEVATITIRRMESTAGAAATFADNGLVTVLSNNSFDQTVQKLQRALIQQGLTIVGVVDHTANAAQADLELPPTLLIIVGNPNLGTPLMQSSRSVAIDLPQKFLIWQDENGHVFVTYNDPQYLASRHNITEQDETLGQIAMALENFAATATDLTPSVSVQDQPVADGTVTVAQAVSGGPGWVVIHAEQDGAPGPVIGHSDILTNGLNSDIVIEIDADAATDTLYAMLHTDAGEAGTYEFPGPDTPVQVNGQVVTPAFNVMEDEDAGDTAMTGDLDWPYYGNDPGGMRFVDVDQINPGNVTQLEPAWIFHTNVFNDFTSSDTGHLLDAAWL